MGYPRGVGHDEDASQWFGMYDTDVGAKLHDWTPAEKAKIEERLLTSNSNGIEYVIVEKPKRKPPYPAYDKQKAQGKLTLADTIATKIVDDGFDVEETILYEQENANRPAVLAALNAIVNPPVAEEELVEA